MRLFEITSQYRALLALEDSEDIPPEVIRDTLEGIEGDFQEKTIAVAKFILSLESSAEAIIYAAEAMLNRGRRLNKRAESIRHYLLLQFQLVDWRKKIEAPDIVISRRNNPVAVQISSETEVPENFWVQPDPPPKRLDKKAIKEALQSGTDVPGAYLESGERVSITL